MASINQGERNDAAVVIQRRFRKYRDNRGREQPEIDLGSEFAALYANEEGAKDEKNRAENLERPTDEENRKGGEDLSEKKKEAEAAIVLQKHFRGYKVRREKQIRKYASDIPKNIERPMLSQQIVDEVTRAMGLLMQQAPGTLDDDQIRRTRALQRQSKSLSNIPRWRPKIDESDEDVVANNQLSSDVVRRGRAPSKRGSLWSLKTPSMMPHPLKKRTNYLRKYLKLVGKPEKASASIRARFKHHPKVQPPGLTGAWDLKKEKSLVSHSQNGHGHNGDVVRKYSEQSLDSWDSQDDKSWTAPLSYPSEWSSVVSQPLQRDPFSYADYDYLQPGSLPSQSKPFYYSSSPTKTGAPIRLEPLPRQTEPKKGPRLNGYAKRYKAYSK